MAKTINTGFITDTINGIKVNSSKRCHKTNYNNRTSRSVTYVVIHYTGNTKDTAQANANYFATGSRKASAHFFVDDKNIFQSVELRDTAWHCGTSGKYYHSSCRNSNSFGIEMCCSGNYKVSQKTKENSAYLCAALCKRLGIAASQVDTYVLRHYDVTHKSCPAQMAGSSNKEWKAFKEDVKAILSSGTISKEVVEEEEKVFTPYLVRITANVLNVRKGAGTDYAVVTSVKKGEVYTIVDEKNGWGKLKSGAGWISLAYTEKV